VSRSIFWKVFSVVTLITLLCLGFCSKTPAPLTELHKVAMSIPALHGNYAVQPQDSVMAGPLYELESVAAVHLGIEVVYPEPVVEVDPNVFGMLQMMPGAIGAASIGSRKRRIEIDPTLRATARFETLGHELGHFLQPRTLGVDSEAEVFAEAVGFLVSRAFGHDTLYVSAKYLAKHKQGLHVLKDYEQEINHAATVLTAGLHKW
jgi:hypothetical protein